MIERIQEPIAPTLLHAMKARRGVQDSGDAHPFFTPSADAQWQADAFTAISLAETSPQLNNKAMNLLVPAMARYAMEQTGVVFEPRREKLYKRVYTEVSSAAKKAHEKEGLVVDPAFAQAVYLEVLPALLSINDISDTTGNERGYNSVDQIVATAMTVMRALQVRDAGGKFSIFQQMCAQYDSGSAHDEQSFSRGLLSNLNSSKVDDALEPVRTVAEVLQRFDVPVEITQAQVAPHGELLLAMVPATVWGYVAKPGGAAEMLEILHAQNSIFPELAQQSLGTTEASDINHRVLAYTEIPVNGENTISSETLRMCELFGELYQAYRDQRNRDESPTQWTQLSPYDVRNLLEYVDYEFNSGSFFYDVAQRNGWTSQDRVMMEIIVRTLGLPDWGTLADTAKFYSRENQRRTVSTADTWQRTIDRQTEVDALLASQKFHPDMTDSQRRQQAENIIQWVDVIANIGIGARAVYNTALYATLGRHVVNMNNGNDAGIMWPLEEDSDRWGLHVMQKVWERFAQDRTLPHFPYVMPAKEKRQPFS